MQFAFSTCWTQIEKPLALPRRASAPALRILRFVNFHLEVPLNLTQNQSNISIQVTPNARSNEVLGFADGAWHIGVAAPPVKGKANKELIAFLSQLLRVSKGSVTIVTGLTGRRKVIAIQGLDQSQVLKAMEAETRG